MKVKAIHFFYFIVAIALIIFGLVLPIISHNNKKAVLKAVNNQNLIEAKIKAVDKSILENYENIDSLRTIRDNLQRETNDLHGSNLQKRLSDIFE